MPARKHIHMYERRGGPKGRFYCGFPDCTHFIQDVYQLVGKQCVCRKCLKEFTLNREKLRRAKPMCDFCSNTQKSADLKKIEHNMDSIFMELEMEQAANVDVETEDIDTEGDATDSESAEQIIE